MTLAVLEIACLGESVLKLKQQFLLFRVSNALFSVSCTIHSAEACRLDASTYGGKKVSIGFLSITVQSGRMQCA